MSIYLFKKDDLDKSLMSLMEKKHVGSRGLTKERHDAVETFKKKFNESLKYGLTDKNVRSCGFSSLEDFKQALIISHLNSMSMSNHSIRSLLNFRREQSLICFPSIPVFDIPDKGDLVKLLSQMSIQQLFSSTYFPPN